ncbi:DUF6941 family protein [Candidatus Omnitrophota bacterium]
MMNIEVFTLCDAATNERGKLNMLGAFDTIFTAKTPSVHPQCSIVLRIRFESIEKGEHKVTVNFVDADGKHVIQPLNAPIRVDLREGQRYATSNLILNIQGLKLAGFSEYSIDLAIDGKQEASLPLLVKEKK